jgi:uncharacterized protein with PIN domain
VSDKAKFIVDHNVGKLTKLLRLMGFDAIFFAGPDDADMLATALAEDRVVLTRDTQIIKRGVVTSGKVKAILIEADKAESQITQIIQSLHLDYRLEPFTLCLECNRPLEERSKEAVKERVLPYVFKTQHQYMECPDCHRIYWRGTHWQAMVKRLEKLTNRREGIYEKPPLP